MKRLASCIAFVAVLSTAQAEVLVGWDVSTLSGTPASITSSVHSAGMVLGQLITRGTGITANAGSGQFSGDHWSTGGSSSSAATAGDYFALTASTSNGFAMVITNFIMRTQRSSTGPTNFAVRTSADNYAADVYVLTNTTINPSNLTANLSITVAGTLEIRIYGYNAGSTAGTGVIPDGGNFGQTGIDVALLGYPAPGPGIPTLSEWGMILLVVVLVGAGAFKIMRQKPDAAVA